jgi:hypothetical protein
MFTTTKRRDSPATALYQVLLGMLTIFDIVLTRMLTSRTINLDCIANHDLRLYKKTQK